MCFNIETSRPLTAEELKVLRLILTDGFVLDRIHDKTTIEDPLDKVLELGPRLNFATAYSTNLVGICHSCGLDAVTRIEKTRRYVLPDEKDREEFAKANHDRMTECVYDRPLESFALRAEPEAVYDIPMKEQEPDALLKVPGLAMDASDRQYYYDYFVGQEGRNPTIVEIMDLNNANSEHSRHGYFKGRQIIDGKEMPRTLLEIIQSTLKANPGNSVIAFKDNSSAIRGHTVWTILPEYPGKPSAFRLRSVTYNIIFTAETHNFPSGVAPFPGAETGTGGRLRDVMATGRGGLVIAGGAGYFVASLHIPDYDLPWEGKDFVYPETLASPLEILIEASNGASDYGNKFGEPVIFGFTRSFEARLPNGERWGPVKPVMFSSGLAHMDALHTEKEEAEEGMYIVQVGGPAYRIGFGGGSASSMMQGENEAKLDFNAVQRGDAEMENKLYRVGRACVEKGTDNPIASIHDQGAGGPANVLKELVEEAGGRIDIRKINCNDPTMSVLEIWVCEYQERNGFLIRAEHLEEFQAICAREKVPCEVLGQVTGDGRFVVEDSLDGSTPVDVEIKKVLGGMPQKIFTDNTVSLGLQPLRLPEGFSLLDHLNLVLRNVAVGSKRFLTTKVDRSVTGLVAQQQCAGPLQLTVADAGVVAHSHLAYSGEAGSKGEQPIKMLVDPARGARMAVAEALTNMMGVRISRLEDIKCSGNWMWAPKLPGEGAALYKAATAACQLMIDLGIAIDGGKDSLSMATRVGDEVVKSCREFVVSAYAPVPDIRKKTTPDLKPEKSALIFLDLSGSNDKWLGGSVFAQVHKQTGAYCPDIEDPKLFKRAFNLVQDLIQEDLILASHDVSDGGLIVTLLEMAFAGNCGLKIYANNEPSMPVENFLFAEEAGLVIQCGIDAVVDIVERCNAEGVPTACIIAYPQFDDSKRILVYSNCKKIMDEDMLSLRETWEETSYQIERLQAHPIRAKQEKKNNFARKGPQYHASFVPEVSPFQILKDSHQFPVAILREEGSNGDREMTSAFYMAGLEPSDVHMSDLLSGAADLANFVGLAAVGGFSYADVPESAKGWAATIRQNDRLIKMFRDFYYRKDTFSLGVCNGFQLFTLLGWVPIDMGIPENCQPRLRQNRSERFESRWSTVKVLPSPSIMLQGMEGSVLGVWVAHGEGQLIMQDPSLWSYVRNNNLTPLVYVDDEGEATESYPFNPNGSRYGITALCSSDGRHLAMMPHPERAFLKWQWPYLPKELERQWEASPWLRMFQNARKWCEKHV